MHILTQKKKKKIPQPKTFRSNNYKLDSRRKTFRRCGIPYGSPAKGFS